MDLVELGVAMFFGGIAGGLVVYSLGLHVLAGRIAALEGDFQRVKGQVWGQEGRAKQKESESELMQAVGEMIVGMQQPEANMTEVLKAVASRHPMVALTLASKFGLKL